MKRNIGLIFISILMACLYAIAEKYLSGEFPSYFDIMIMTFVFRIYLTSPEAPK